MSAGSGPRVGPIEVGETQERMRRWFAAKRQELLASAALAADHPTLVGGHREVFVRTFLREFLPARLSADRGIVYSPISRSGECDVVIWDSANFPRLAMLDHSSFFAEGVIAVVEIKSRYSADQFVVCREQCERLRQLSMEAFGANRFQHEWEILNAQVSALATGATFEGMGRTEPRIHYATVFLRGGEDTTVSDLVEVIDGDPCDDFPDSVIFVEAGRHIQRLEPDWDQWKAGAQPQIRRFDSGDYVLAHLADDLLRLIGVKSFGTDGLNGLHQYLWAFAGEEPVEVVPYALSRMPYGYDRWFSFPAPPEPGPT